MFINYLFLFLKWRAKSAGQNQSGNSPTSIESEKSKLVV